MRLMKSQFILQTVGPCDVKDIDLAGHERQVYLCKQTQDEDFTLVNIRVLLQHCWIICRRKSKKARNRRRKLKRRTERRKERFTVVYSF